VTVNVTGVHSSAGNILANLCDDPKAQFPGGCATYQTMAIAQQGVTVLEFKGVKPGSYAVQLFHDEDGNMFPNIPPEGFGYGNDQPYPPDFAKSSIKVAGDTTTNVKMTYLGAPTTPTGQKGAPAPAGVTKVDLRENGLYGELYVPASDKPVPAIIVLGGSEGGVMTASQVGVGFAKHGYAVLALAYFQEEGLPKTLEGVPLEYFDKGVEWLKKQKGIDANHIGVIGGSRGSEAALLLGSRRKDITAVAAFAPSNYVWQGLGSNPMAAAAAWTLAGKAIPFVTPDGAAYRPDNMKLMFTNAIDKKPAADTEIAVEKINGPILFISGKADALWPSADMSNRAVARLKAKGFKHKVENWQYDGAGHLVFMGDPTSPGAISMSKAAPNPMLGGTGEAGMKAWTDNWPKTLAFFDAALKGKQ
jgi:dienelactone hydrolase/uncharacterized protein (DUF2141 family)